MDPITGQIYTHDLRGDSNDDDDDNMATSPPSTSLEATSQLVRIGLPTNTRSLADDDDEDDDEDEKKEDRMDENSKDHDLNEGIEVMRVLSHHSSLMDADDDSDEDDIYTDEPTHQFDPDNDTEFKPDTDILDDDTTTMGLNLPSPINEPEESWGTSNDSGLNKNSINATAAETLVPLPPVNRGGITSDSNNRHEAFPPDEDWRKRVNSVHASRTAKTNADANGNRGGRGGLDPKRRLSRSSREILNESSSSPEQNSWCVNLNGLAPAHQTKTLNDTHSDVPSDELNHVVASKGNSRNGDSRRRDTTSVPNSSSRSQDSLRTKDSSRYDKSSTGSRPQDSLRTKDPRAPRSKKLTAKEVRRMKDQVESDLDSVCSHDSDYSDGSAVLEDLDSLSSFLKERRAARRSVSRPTDNRRRR
eukprot:scaffold20098_cov50-Attheya_sp.AAC.2